MTETQKWTATQYNFDYWKMQHSAASAGHPSLGINLIHGKTSNTYLDVEVIRRVDVTHPHVDELSGLRQFRWKEAPPRAPRDGPRQRVWRRKVCEVEEDQSVTYTHWTVVLDIGARWSTQVDERYHLRFMDHLTQQPIDKLNRILPGLTRTNFDQILNFFWDSSTRNTSARSKASKLTLY